MQSSFKPQALLALITAAALAPFLNKAFYVDDPLFIWMAQQIVRHPLDPYGFDVNLSSFTQPMSAVTQNPPLCSYYIAAVASVFGWSEIKKKAQMPCYCFYGWGATFCFAAFFNWSITARTFLAMAPATAISVVRHLGCFRNLGALKYAPLLAGAGLSILIAIADYSEANCARAAAQLLQERYRAEVGKVWFQGHCGFQYYMEQWGAKPFDRKNPQVAHGDLLVGLFTDTNIAQLSAETVATWSESTFSAVPVVSTLRSEQAQVSTPACTARCPG